MSGGGKGKGLGSRDSDFFGGTACGGAKTRRAVPLRAPGAKPLSGFQGALRGLPARWGSERRALAAAARGRLSPQTDFKNSPLGGKLTCCWWKLRSLRGGFHSRFTGKSDFELNGKLWEGCTHRRAELSKF